MFNVVRTKISIYRNVKDFKFVPKLDEQSKQKIVENVTNALPNFVQTKPDLIKAETLSKLYGLNFSKSNLALINKTEDVGITFFDGEHLTITSSCFGYNNNIFDAACNVADQLSNKIAFAYNDEYGFLTSDLTKIGNAIKLECDIALTGLKQLEKISQVVQNVQKLRFKLTKTEDSDIYTLSSVCNLGYTREEVIAEFEKMVQKVQELETESIKLLAASKQDEVYDDYVRAVAILKNAHILTYDELKTFTNQLRVGLNLGYTLVNKESVEKLQQIILNKNSQFVSKSELLELAKTVKEILKGE